MSIPSRIAGRSLVQWLMLALLCASCGFPPYRSGSMQFSMGRAELGGARSRPGRIATTSGTTRVDITGTLVLDTQESPQIELPVLDVWLEDLLTNTTVSSGVTRLDGRFHLTGANSSRYRVCWKGDGLGSGCTAAFPASPGSKYLNTIVVPAPFSVISGKVLTGDGRPCWINEPFFDLDVSTRVSLFDARSQLVQTVTANFQGEYAFAGVPGGNRYVVQAECEESSKSANVSVGATEAILNLTLPNRAPRINGLAAFDGGPVGLTRAPLGARVRVESIVRDPESDTIEYLWRAADDPAVTAGLPQHDWQLASTAGLQTLYLVARDRKGGYAFKRFALPVSDGSLIFTGRVIDETTRNAVTGAAVSVNGVSGTTNAQGWFSVSVSPVATSRYVMNIHHPNFALLSRVHDKESSGNTYELIRAQTTFHNPGQVINILDTSSSGPCGGREQDPTGECRHRGARLVLPAGSLVDSNGNVPSGNIRASVATLNPERRALPGDYRAITAANTAAELLSFGATYAEFRDGSGNLLNLRPGTTAQLRQPVSPLQLPSAAPTIAMWSYDEQSGFWVEEGVATLTNTAEGWMYIGTTTHFSTINMDVAGSDPAQATCVRLELGASLAGWTNLVLRAYVSYAGTSVQVKETPLDNAQYHAIYRIPYAPPAPGPNTLRLELRGTYGGQQVVLLNNIIATDAPRPKMTGTNLWPPYPYTECGTPIVLEADPVNLPQYGDNDGFGKPAFLTGPYGTFLPPNGEQIATDYYNTIDPGNTKPTLEAWWLANNFDATGFNANMKSAAYLNHNDLGFGRDMNCLKNGSDLACYVTNYGLPDQNPTNADDAANKNAAKRGATVAMEYKASEPADRRVRFYVYNAGNPNTAGKLKFADLDGLGPKPVPHLCIVCHGGYYDPGTNNVTEARFREFDLPSFKYSGNRSWDFAPAPNTLSNAELTAFASLNEMIRDVAPSTSPIKDLINAWYTGGFGPNTPPIKPAVPAGWATQVNGYHNVYGQSCRTCHVARDNGVTNNFYTFNLFSQFQTGSTTSTVCDSPKKMPNAFVTYKNFWSDTQRVIDFKNLMNPVPATCQ